MYSKAKRKVELAMRQSLRILCTTSFQAILLLKKRLKMQLFCALGFLMNMCCYHILNRNFQFVNIRVTSYIFLTHSEIWY